MEIMVNITFTSPEKDSDFWAQLAEGLCDHQRGAWLEEQFEYFSEAACTLVAEMMDECDKTNAGGEALIFETWSKDGNRFATCINGGWVIFDLLPRIKELLLLCGVQDLYLDNPEGEEC